LYFYFLVDKTIQLVNHWTINPVVSDKSVFKAGVFTLTKKMF